MIIEWYFIREVEVMEFIFKFLYWLVGVFSILCFVFLFIVQPENRILLGFLIALGISLHLGIWFGVIKKVFD